MYPTNRHTCTYTPTEWTESNVSKLEIVEWATGEVVETVNVDGMPDRMVERVTAGMLTNMDRERFGVREVKD